MKRTVLGKVRRGFHRRLHVGRFLTAGKMTLVQVSIAQLQDAYDGDVKEEGQWWGVELAEGEHVLFDSFGETLAFIDQESLKDAIAADPHAFAEATATEHGFPRSSVIAHGTIVESIARDYGLGKKLAFPKFSRGVLSCQFAVTGGLDDIGRFELWSVRASIAGEIVSKKRIYSKK